MRMRGLLLLLGAGSAACVRQGPLPSRHAVRPRADAAMQAGGVQFGVRKQPKSQVALDINIPAELANEVHMQVLKDLSKTQSVPGFRKGKAPKEAIISALGIGKIKKATVEQCIDVGMQQSSAQVQLNTCGEAKLEDGTSLDSLAESYKVGDELSFTVVVDVYPQVPLAEEKYKGLNVEVEKVPFNQDAFDAAVRKLQDQHADLVPLDAPAQPDHVLQVDMVGFMAAADGSKGDPLPALAGGENVALHLKEGKFMPGLVEGMLGVTKGETRDIAVTFPSRSSTPQLAGKDAVFEVTCNLVQEKQVMEMSDAFADRVKPGMTLEELTGRLTEGVNNEAEEQQREKTHVALGKALVECADDFEVPESMIEQVTKERFASMLAQMREQGTPDEKIKEIISKENYDRYCKISRPMTILSVKTDLSIKTVGSQQALSVPVNEVDDEVMTLQAQTLQRGEKFKESEVRPRIEATLEKKMILDWLAGHATIEYVDEMEVTAEEILGASPEKLAADVMGVPESAVPKKEVAEAGAAPEAAPEPEPEAASETPPAEEEADGGAPNGFEWGGTF